MNTRKWMCVIIVMAGVIGAAQAQTTNIWANANVTATTTPTSLNWINAPQAIWTGGTPVSGNLNTIQFFNDTTTPFVNTVDATQASILDNGGTAFQLGTLTLSGRGSSTEWQDLTMNLSGDALNFSAATGTVKLNAMKASSNRSFVTYNVANDIQLGTASSATALTFTGNGDSVFNVGGIISELQSGGGSIVKNGTSTLTLSNTNSFSGGVFINGGILNLPAGATSANLGDSGNIVTFTGNGTIYFNSNTTLAQGIAINAGVAGTLHMYKLTVTINNPLTGSGTLNAQAQGDGFGGLFEFTNTNNTFSGDISIYNSSGASYAAELRMNSLDDTPGRRIKLANTAAFTYGAGAVVPLVLSNRQIEHNASSAFLNNNATNVNCTVTVNTNLIVSGNRPFTLGGSNIGNNTFAGAITTNVTSLTKASAGKWILTGANTYTGTTTISDGTLEFASRGTYAGNISVTDTTPNPLTFSGTYTQTVSGVISGTMSLIKEGTGTLILTGANTHTNTMVNAGTLSLGNGTSSSSLYDFSTLSVASGAKVNLNYTGSDKVLYLNLGGSPAAKGTWGATGSGADHTSDTYFTGTGMIDNLEGDTTGINIAYWDGGSTNIIAAGNMASAGGSGTWNTTTQNWDYGVIAHKAWANTTDMKAVFSGTVGTVTLGSDITLGTLSLQGTVSTPYVIGGASETYTLNFGGTNMIDSYGIYTTIRTGITGSPTIYYTTRSGDNNSALTLEPVDPLTMTLGTVNMYKNWGGLADAVLNLGGSSLGNVAAAVTWSSGNQQLKIFKVGTSTWTVNDFSNHGAARVVVSSGTLIANGTWNPSHQFDVTGGTLGGTGTLSVANTTASEIIRVLSGSIAPGNPTGTMNIADDCSIAGTLKININGSQVGTLAIDPTKTLTITGATLNANVIARPIYPVTIATYGSGKLTGTFASNNLPGGWTISYGATAITLTPPAAGTLIFMK
jgi:fibronectin-binding autotransporter adhesin